MRRSGAFKTPCVYIIVSRPGGAFYIGVTSNLLRRVAQHKAQLTPGYTARYNVARLVWFEVHETMSSAIAREKTMKKWRRAWKQEFVTQANPLWRDLCDDLR